MRDFEKIYQMLGVKIDLTLGESFYEKQLDEAINACLERKIAVNNDDGSVAVNFSDESLPSYLLRKKRWNSSLYATRDIAAARFKLKLLIRKKLFMSLAVSKLFILGRFSKHSGFWNTMSGNSLMPLSEWFLCRKERCPLAKVESFFWKT